MKKSIYLKKNASSVVHSFWNAVSYRETATYYGLQMAQDKGDKSLYHIACEKLCRRAQMPGKEVR